MQPCKWQFEWYSGGSAWLGTTDSEARGVEGWRWWQTGPVVVVVVVAAILCSIHIEGKRHERTLVVVGGLCTWR